MTIFVRCQLIVTLDSIRNSCDVWRLPWVRSRFRLFSVCRQPCLCQQPPHPFLPLPLAPGKSPRFLFNDSISSKDPPSHQMFGHGLIGCRPHNGLFFLLLLPLILHSSHYCRSSLKRQYFHDSNIAINISYDALQDWGYESLQTC